MKKFIIIFMILIPIIVCGSYLYYKLNPPLAIQNGSAYQKGKEVLLLEVGNKHSFADIKITELLVNNYKQPSKAKVQVSNHSKGFIITDDFNSEEASKYQFKSINNVNLKPNTDPQQQLRKVNEGTVTDDDLIYAITLGHQSSIEKVIIKYQYLGLSYKKVVTDI